MTQAQAVPAAPVEPVQQKRRLQDQPINTKAKEETAAEAYGEIKRQTQTLGFSPSPDTTRAIRRAEMSLQAAAESVERGAISEATANQMLGTAGSL